MVVCDSIFVFLQFLLIYYNELRGFGAKAPKPRSIEGEDKKTRSLGSFDISKLSREIPKLLSGQPFGVHNMLRMFGLA